MIADAAAFTDQWVRAWNAHDIEAVLAHFADDVVFSSPLAGRVLPETGGIVRGRAELRKYWETALPLSPDLRFEIVGSYVGVDALVVNYRNQRGGLVNEVLVFDGDLVVAGYATYLASGS